MSFKKFISGVSAIAIAASAFAAMAVTANAETTAFSKDFTAVNDSTDPADYGFTLSYGAGSGSSLVNYTVTDGVLKCVSGPYASSTAGARTGTATATFDAIGVGNEVTVSYVWALGSATGNATGSYTKTRIGNASGAALELSFYGSENNGTLKVNNTAVESGNSAIRNTTINVTATLDVNTNKITALTLDNSNNSFDYTLAEAIDFKDNISTLDRFEFENSERQNWSNTSSVDNITITYEEAKVAAGEITIRYVDNADTTVQIADQKVISANGKYVGDTVTVAYPVYMLVDDTLYSRGTNSNEYRQTITYTDNSQTVLFRYSATEITNVVYYSEAENIDGVTNSGHGGNAVFIPSRSSNAEASYANEDVTITTLQPGIYHIYGSMYSGNSGGGSLDFAVGENEFSYSESGKTNRSEIKDSGEITVTEPAALIFKKSGSNTIALDYIYVVKTGEYVPPVEKTEITVNVGSDSVTLESEEDMSGVVVVGYYDSNNKFLRAETYTAQSVINAPALGEGENAIVFWWSDITGNITPVCEAVAVGAATIVE